MCRRTAPVSSQILRYSAGLAPLEVSECGAHRVRRDGQLSCAATVLAQRPEHVDRNRRCRIHGSTVMRIEGMMQRGGVQGAVRRVDGAAANLLDADGDPLVFYPHPEMSRLAEIIGLLRAHGAGPRGN